ncbi:MAG: hypothetical protein Q8K96_02095 [Rubrivivax sp.]|nr:hypothetical protein [Rubrivivax sp.]
MKKKLVDAKARLRRTYVKPTGGASGEVSEPPDPPEGGTTPQPSSAPSFTNAKTPDAGAPPPSSESGYFDEGRGSDLFFGVAGVVLGVISLPLTVTATGTLALTFTAIGVVGTVNSGMKLALDATLSHKDREKVSEAWGWTTIGGQLSGLVTLALNHDAKQATKAAGYGSKAQDALSGGEGVYQAVKSGLRKELVLSGVSAGLTVTQIVLDEIQSTNEDQMLHDMCKLPPASFGMDSPGRTFFHSPATPEPIPRCEVRRLP